MTQISRPLQIALAAVVLAAAVWFIALRGHSSGAESSSSTPASATSSPAASGGSSASASGSKAAQSAPGGGTPASSDHPYTGSAPGVAGLTRAIDKARGAVKDSEQNAKALQQKAAQASSASQAAAASSSGGSSAGAQTRQASAPTTTSTAPAQTSTAPSHAVAGAHATPAPASKRATAPAVAGAPSKQAVVEGELKRGRTVIVLFWSPKGAVDVADHNELALLQAIDKRFGTGPNRNIAVHDSSAAEVGQYGTITRSLQVFQTPTMLVISPSGQTKTLTGLVDAYAIQQAIKEARHS